MIKPKEEKDASKGKAGAAAPLPSMFPGPTADSPTLPLGGGHRSGPKSVLWGTPTPLSLARGMDEGAVRGAEWEGGGGGAARLNAARKCVSPPLPIAPRKPRWEIAMETGGHGLHADPFSFSGVPRSGGAHTGGSARAAALRAVGVSFGAVRVCGAGIPGAVLSPCVGMDASGGVAAAAGTAGRRARS